MEPSDSTGSTPTKHLPHQPPDQPPNDPPKRLPERPFTTWSAAVGVLLSLIVAFVILRVSPFGSSYMVSTHIDPMLPAQMQAISQKSANVVNALQAAMSDIDKEINRLLSLDNTTSLIYSKIAAMLSDIGPVYLSANASSNSESSNQLADDEFQPGLGLAISENLQAKYPVVIIPGIASTLLEAWAPVRPQSASTNSSQQQSSAICAAWKTNFRQKVWGSLNQFRLLLLDKACWVEYMKLDPITGLDQPHARLRPSKGFESIDYLFPGYWVFARIFSNLAAIGADPNLIHVASYDWRLSFTNLEKRDRYFTRLKAFIEQSFHTTGQKSVIVAHSMGNLVFMHFLNWVQSDLGGRAGSDWPDKYLKHWVNIAGPMLGTPKALPSLLSGETRDSAILNPYAMGLLEQVLPRSDRAALFRSWGSMSSLLPKGGSTIWGKQDQVAPDVLNSKRSHPLAKHTSHIITVNHSNNDAISSNAAKNTIGYTADTVMDALKKIVGEPFASRWTREWDTLIATSHHHLNRSLLKPSSWSNPLTAPLPSFPSGQFGITCMYGVGMRSERSYSYQVSLPPDPRIASQQCDKVGQDATDDCSLEPTFVDTDGLVHAINTTHRDPAMDIENGVQMTDGDGTVVLLSLGYMCAHGWRQSRYNPSNVAVVTREITNGKSASSSIPTVRGSDRADHVDILGNREMLTELLRIVSGSKHAAVTDHFVSEILDIAKRIHLPALHDAIHS
eukprot:jgi/Hompol1/5534/HPOL_002005-RA